jgi:hypothetical protein
MTDASKTTDLAAQLADALDRIKTLEAKVSPPAPKPFVPDPPRPRFDPTAHMSMPASVVAEMAKVGAETMAPVIADTRRSTVQTLGQGQSSVPGYNPVGNNGWVEARPLPANPPGYHHIERMLDAQDASDAAERVRRAGLNGGG